MSLAPGTCIGPYEVVASLGAGGMGEVYRAVDRRLSRAVAIKLLSSDHATAAAQERFRSEVRLTSSLSHPHILTVYDVAEIDGRQFLVTELVDGGTLREWARGRKRSWEEIVGLLAGVADGLAVAHDAGIVHRDVKPDNILVATNGYAKLADFGLAKLFEDTRATRITDARTQIGAIVGTIGYLSPEQAMGRPIDARSDVFSFGVVLYELLAGHRPFEGTDSLDELQRVVDCAPEPLGAEIPAPLRRIVAKALEKNPASRYQRMREMAVDLRQIPRDGVTRVRVAYIVAAAVVVVLVGAVAALAYRRTERRHWVREQAVPDIAGFASRERSALAFLEIQTAERYLPQDPDLLRAVNRATRIASVASSPSGAVVEVKDYSSPTENWLRLGVTPLDHVRVPSGVLRWRVSKPGGGELTTAPQPADSLRFDLEAAGRAPEAMVPVPAQRWGDYLAFLGPVGPYDMPSFFVDKFEVTNRQYQEFVDKGGYTTRAYWKEPLVRNRQEVSWDEAMKSFRDPTGRPGPATWEGGHYPAGKADYPVSGVSWYEAAAYAVFAGKSLPVIAQAAEVAPVELDKYASPMGNASPNLARVGQSDDLGPYGTYDMLGNAREWAWNSAGGDLHFGVGRQAASYGPEVLSAFDRSALNGFRCVVNAAPVPADAVAPRLLERRDFSKTQPVDDNVFRLYRNMYAYDRTPLRASVEAATGNSGDWTREKVAFDAAYGNERVPAYLFLPKGARPPFQLVVFFPSARVNRLPSSDALGDLAFMDYVVKSGRAVIYPIYKNLYERWSGYERGGMLRRETVVDWSKDLGRALDYAQTRPDIDKTRIGYLGVSQGAADGVILATIDDRLKAVVLLDGGFFQQQSPPPGLDQVDFAPRLTKPVLMVNGRYDATFPLDTAQTPLFRMLGTPAADKRHVVFDTPHDVSQRPADLMKEVLAWYDKYLGRVD